MRAQQGIIDVDEVLDLDMSKLMEWAHVLKDEVDPPENGTRKSSNGQVTKDGKRRLTDTKEIIAHFEKVYGK